MTLPRAQRHAQATKARARPSALSWARDLKLRARNDKVRALAARPGSSTAAHHHKVEKVDVLVMLMQGIYALIIKLEYMIYVLDLFL